MREGDVMKKFLQLLITLIILTNCATTFANDDDELTDEKKKPKTALKLFLKIFVKNICGTAKAGLFIKFSKDFQRKFYSQMTA